MIRRYVQAVLAMHFTQCRQNPSCKCLDMCDPSSYASAYTCTLDKCVVQGTNLDIIIKAFPVPLLEETEGDALARDAHPQPLQGLATLLPCCMPPAHKPKLNQAQSTVRHGPTAGGLRKAKDTPWSPVTFPHHTGRV